MPTFDGKSEKFDLFEDFLQRSVKVHNHLTEEDRINYFQFVIKGDALQTFKNLKTILAQPEGIWEKLRQFFERNT